MILNLGAFHDVCLKPSVTRLIVGRLYQEVLGPTIDRQEAIERHSEPSWSASECRTVDDSKRISIETGLSRRYLWSSIQAAPFPGQQFPWGRELPEHVDLSEIVVAISFECDHCGQKLKAHERLAGRKIKCPGCQMILEVVATDEPTLDDRKQKESGRTESATAVNPDNPFAGNWLNSDAVEDSRSRRERAAARKTRLEQIRMEREAEEEVEQQAKKKGKVKSVTAQAADSDEEEPFRYHWIYLVALLPLALSIFFGKQSLIDRLNRSTEANPDIAPLMEQASSLTELLMAFPDHRIEGALLARDSSFHWFMGAVSAASFLGLLFGMFPGTHRRTLRLLRVGLFTGTIGVLTLLAFQFIAHVTSGIRLRGRGIGILILLIIQLIGFSYRCTEDPTIGFWGSFFGFTIGVGLCEELCKSVPIWHYLRTARKIGWRGACLTGLASGIGFGVSEGIMYSGSMYNGLSDGLTYVVRFVSCVSLHAMWSGSVALMMYRNQDFLDTDEWSSIVAGFTYYISVAMILHGVYDTLLKHDMEALALLIGIGSYLWLFFLVQRSRGT